ncbi:MAG: hypothetical protein ACLRI8_11345 [Agathobacter rectalis]
MVYDIAMKSLMHSPPGAKLFDDELAANNQRIPTNSLSRQMRKAI